MVYPTSNANLNTSFSGSSAQSGVHAPHHDALATEVNAIETDLLPGGALRTTIDGKAPAVHTHAEADVTSLVTDLGSKATATGGTLAHPAISDFVEYTDQGADAATPAAGKHRIYSKSGGLYVVSSAGTVIGPLAAGAGGVNAPFQFAPGFIAPVSGDYQKIRLSVATTFTAFGAQRNGGTGATIDVQRNGMSILTAPISLTAATWTTGTLIASPNGAIGDIITVILSGVSGSPSDIITSLDGSRLTF